MDRVAAVGLALLLALAGCNAPFGGSPATAVDDGATAEPDTDPVSPTVAATPEPARNTSRETPTPTTPRPDPAAIEVPGSFPVDAGLVYARVEQLLAERASPPAVELVGSTEPARQAPYTALVRDEFDALLGIGPPRSVGESDLSVGGATTSNGVVVLTAFRGATPALIERTLAHEYTHAVQFATGADHAVESALPPARADTSDATLVRRSVVEGAAVYTASRYVRLYMPRYPTELTTLRRFYPNASAGTKLRWAAYLRGGEYAAARLDSPAALSRIYERPPRTTEQLLHVTRDEPAPLRVDGAESRAWTLAGRDSRGELYVRIALGSELPRRDAARAAAGWGNDELLVYRSGTTRGFAWTLRWDDARNATAFAAAVERYLDRHARPDGEGWRTDDARFRTVRPDEETVVLLAGPRAFVAGTTVTGSGGSVRVAPPG